MKNIPHPIQYQGSKRNLAPIILRYFPRRFERLIEPFAGSAAITIAAAARGLASGYVINDLNRPLSDLLRWIVERPEDLAASYEAIWQDQHGDSVEHYYHIRNAFNNTQDPTLFLYLLARCVKGAVRYNSEGLFNQSPDKRRYGTRPATMKSNIMAVSQLLKGKAAFHSTDYKEVLSMATKDDLVYMDPPYQGVSGERDFRYVSGVTIEDFTTALEDLNVRGISYIVSYDGRRGDKTFGKPLPDFLHLTRVEIDAGRSSQATLLGKAEVTYESLYLSQALVAQLTLKPVDYDRPRSTQLALFEPATFYA